MREVAYTRESVDKCWCGQCPVQAQSACANERYAESEDTLERGEMPTPGKLPGLYCAIGEATCDDLSITNRCFCPQCLIWGESALAGNHYCALGKPLPASQMM